MSDDEMTTDETSGAEASPVDVPVSDVNSQAEDSVTNGEGSSADSPADVAEAAASDEELGLAVDEAKEEVNEFGFSASEMYDDDEEDDDEDEDASPIEELIEEEDAAVDLNDLEMNWYILKVQVNREKSICENLKRRVRLAGLDAYFGDILVPTEDVREYSKSGKQRIVKRKLYPGYIVVHMAITDESWFMVRETSGIGDFTGTAGKPAPLAAEEIDRIISTTKPSEDEEGEEKVKIGIKFKVGDQVRVKEGYFQNYEGEVSSIDERNGRITVMINIFGRNNPVELDHWQVEDV